MRVSLGANREKMINLDISGFSTGIYFLQYNSGTAVYSQKVIKQE